MIGMTKKTRALVIAIALMATGAATRAHAAETYRVSDGEVTVLCPLTVGGSFEAKTKTLTGEIAPATDQPGAIRGTLKVDLQTLETGIGMRDRHMRDNYLQVEKGPTFSTATFDDIRIEKLEGKTVFSGILTLHGQRKKISGAAELQQHGGRIRVQAQFALKVSDFEIPAPTYLGIGVRDEIQIKVTLTAMPSETVAAATTAPHR
jgi:polyisoprenoid-binding protein YceI